MRKMKKLVALLLVAALELSLTACSKKPGNTPGPNNTAAPEFVYTPEYRELYSGTQAMYPAFFTDEGFYSTVYEKVSDEVPEGALYNFKGPDGTYEYRIYFVGFDGSVTRLEAYAPVEVQDERLEAYPDHVASSSISSLTVDPDGNLLVIENRFLRYYDGPEGIEPGSDEYWGYLQYEDEYYIRTLDRKGGEISSAKIELPEESYLYAYAVEPDGKGNLLVSSEMSVLAIAPDGSIAYKIEAENWIDSMVRMKDGQVGVLSYGENGLELNLLDLEKKAFGDAYELPNGAWELIPGGGEYDFYYVSGINLFGYDMAGKTSEKLLNWLNCDIDNSDLNKVRIGEDGAIYGILNKWDDSYENVTTELVMLSKVPYESVPHKESIRLAVFNMGYQVRRMVIDFNRNSDKYHIDVTDYSEYSTGDDYEAGLTKLTTEIMAGNVPDIMAMNSLPYAQLASKGFLEELYPYIDADPAFDRSDFFENVFAALEVDGGLYQICPAFTIMTAVGARSVVGDTPGWTFEEFEAALASMPEGCDPFDYYTTKEDILRVCLYMDIDSFVDWGAGKCSFDSENFINLLKFANRFLDDFDWENYDYNYEDSNTENRIAQGRQMLMQASIYSLNDVIYNDFYFGGDGTSATSTYIGYPTSSGIGSALSLQQGFAMSSKCQNKDGAWEFLRTLLTEEYQEKLWYIPSNRNVFEAQLKKITEPQYRTDENGEFILDEDGEKIPQSIASWWFEDGRNVDIYEMTDEQADMLRELIESTDKIYETNSGVFDIVLAEAKAYFLGQKPVEEVARLIQSKVNIYVNEQK